LHIGDEDQVKIKNNLHYYNNMKSVLKTNSDLKYKIQIQNALKKAEKFFIKCA